jgi:uncharacterized protein YbjT (DUF2867 family)
VTLRRHVREIVMTTPILVTGGSGTLGSPVVARLRAAGREVRVLSRRSHPSEEGVVCMTGDLLTGEGVDAAVAGVDTIIHCAGSFKDDVKMTETLVRTASLAGAPHIVYISVVGTDRIPVVGFGRLTFLYFRNKKDAERVVSESGLPWTTLRATQFYDLFLIVGRGMSKLPVIPVPARFRFQPVAVEEVAARLVELALGEPAGYVADIGGPRVYRMVDLIRSYLRAAHRRRVLVPMWIGGKTARTIRGGGNLVAAAIDPAAAGNRKTWEEFLAERVTQPSIRTATQGVPSGS